ncbi:MAG TPA: RdgB/HAM1 family non-canonical purine NTP pyrophosphatase [Rhizomicrobium sp.]|jgi:XTP/dITP diphosphohydrolase|nr:RdgB/HAM1 family non-canonical purine NTP pyrophosphatase [Rhizomicrobium sp.]
MTIRLPRGSTLIVASHNSGKVREIHALLGPHGIHAVSAGDLNLPEPEETGTSFVANAELKALAAAKAGGHAALADDSGLCVEALDGAPGIYSARWAGPTKDFRLAINRVHDELRRRHLSGSPAAFVCALTVALPDGEHQTFEGTVHGKVVFPPRGDRGFGYDPIFIADTMDQTFGELDPAVKHAISHRAIAFGRLLHSGIFTESL